MLIKELLKEFDSSLSKRGRKKIKSQTYNTNFSLMEVGPGSNVIVIKESWRRGISNGRVHYQHKRILFFLDKTPFEKDISIPLIPLSLLEINNVVLF